MSWTYKFSTEAKRDLGKLDNSQKAQIIKKIRKVSENPLSRDVGGMGIPLGNKFGYNLTGYYEVKHRGLGIRAIYELIGGEMVMLFIAVDSREDEQVCKTAYNRIK